MTLNEYIDNKKLAINVQFVMRHSASCNGAYLRKVRAERRQKLRSLIREVRMASSSDTSFMVEAVVASLPVESLVLH